MPEIKNFNENTVLENSDPIQDNTPSKRLAGEGRAPRREEDNQAVAQFLQNYQCTKSSAYQQSVKSKTWAEAKTKREEKNTENTQTRKQTKKGTGKGLYIAAALAILVAIGSILAVIKPTFFSREDKEQTTIDIIAQYKEYAEAATAASPEFNYVKWDSPNEALEDFANLINPGLPDIMQVKPSANGSYALAGKDPWGNPYYITAKQLGSEGPTYAYDFYITSGGENGQFAVDKLVLDKDDISELMMSMADFASHGGSHIVFDPIQSETFLPDDPIENLTPIPITFDAQGGTGGDGMVETYLGKMLPNIEIPVKEGFVFNGYYEAPEGIGIRYFDRAGEGCFISPFDKGTTLYALWTEEKIIETPVDIEQSGTEGEQTADTSGDTELSEPTTDVPQQDPSQGDSKPSATPDQQQGTEITPPANSEQSGSSEQEKAPIKIRYNIKHYVMDTSGNYPSTPSGTGYGTTNADTAVVFSTKAWSSLVADGYTYYSHAEVNGKSISRQKMRNGDTVCLYYARYKNTVTATGDAGVQSITGQGIHYAGEKVTVAAAVAPYYSFVGWSGSYAGKDKAISFTMPNAAITLSATTKNNAPSYSITLDPNGGTVSTKEYTVKEGSNIGAIPTPKYGGYTFLGWFTSEGTKISPDTVYHHNEPLTLHAKWTPASVTAIFDMQGGSGGTAKAEGKYGQDLGPITVPTKPGYIFSGYYTEPNGKGTKFYDASGSSAICWFTNEKTYYAYWIAN